MPNFSEIPWIAKHIELYKTDPEKAHMWDSKEAGGSGPLPTLLLTTKGRKSGKPLLLPLIYGETEGGYVIIASKGGAPAHPSWYLNLTANPDVKLQVGPERLAAKARTVTGPERETLWKQMVAVYAPYTQYQERTEREIPVVVLERQ